MENFQDLMHSTICEGMSEKAVETLCSRAEMLSCEAGHRLFEQGQEARDLMILREGVVELSFSVVIMGATRELTVEAKKPGDVVAWSALVRPYRFTLSAHCASACTVARLSRTSLEALFKEDGEIGYLFMRNLSGVIGRRLQNLQAKWLGDLESRAHKME